MVQSLSSSFTLSRFLAKCIVWSIGARKNCSSCKWTAHQPRKTSWFRLASSLSLPSSCYHACWAHHPAREWLHIMLIPCCWKSWKGKGDLDLSSPRVIATGKPNAVCTETNRSLDVWFTPCLDCAFLQSTSIPCLVNKCWLESSAHARNLPLWTTLLSTQKINSISIFVLARIKTCMFHEFQNMKTNVCEVCTLSTIVVSCKRCTSLKVMVTPILANRPSTLLVSAVVLRDCIVIQCLGVYNVSACWRSGLG